jgi:nicotinamidase-related amidase
MLQAHSTGLLLVDVQGSLARMVHNSEALISNIEKLIKCCQHLSIPIVWLEQYPKGLGRTVPELAILLENEKVFEKQTFNALLNTDIEQRVTQLGNRQWLVAGIEAHICVYQSAMGLKQRGFEVEIVTDCISSRAQYNLDLAISKMAQQNIAMTSLEMCVYELMKEAGTIEFKQILPIIK